MSAGPDLSPRAARTRAALVAAGFDLLAKKPIDAIAIDELVAAAGVAKGSFFNHFADKPAFAAALAADVRREVEALVGKTNRGVTDPVARIAGGMRVSAAFALDQPKRTAVLLRSGAGVTSRNHPLNQGVAADLDAALAAGLLRAEAAASGVLYWLGLCLVLMTHVLAHPGDRRAAAQALRDMTILGLTGLGVSELAAAAVAEASAATIAGQK